MSAEERVLHTDSDGYRVILHKDGNKENWYVTYDRYPGKKYRYLCAEQAAELILQGEILKLCYIEALTVDALKGGYDNLMASNSAQVIKGEFEDQGETRLRIGGTKITREGPKLNSSILLEGCLIGGINLSGVIFDGRIDFDNFEGQRTHILGVADFNEAIFCGTAYFIEATFNDVADFSKAIFCGTAYFKQATFCGGAFFEDAIFGRAAIFSEATFSGVAVFEDAEFCGVAIFSEATFNDVAYLSAGFTDNAFFKKATFSGEVDFMWAAFIGEADFRSAVFRGDARFNGATFGDEANFTEATFINYSDFSDANFLVADFSKARFEKACHMNSITAGSISFRLAVLRENLRISTLEGEQLKRKQEHIEEMTEYLHRMGKERIESECERDDDVDMEEKEREKEWFEHWVGERLKRLDGWRATPRGLASLNFQDVLVQGQLHCEFGHIIPEKGRPVIKPHRIAEGFDEPEEGWKRQDYWERAQKQYAWLKEQYRKQGRYEDEDNAHWWAMECKRQTVAWSASGWLLVAALVLISLACLVGWLGGKGTGAVSVILGFIGVCALLPRFGWFALFRVVFGYGVKPRNIVATIFVVIIACAVCYYFWGNNLYTEHSPTSNAVANALYFSVITYATVGYGDISPQGWLVGLAMVEGLLGVVLNAALIVVIFRKLIR